MALSKTGELTTESWPGTRWTRPLIGDIRSESDLADLARVVSGREEAGAGQLAPVPVRDLETSWDHLAARYPKEFELPPSRLLAWTRRGAAECEARELWAGALRHLDVLVAESPDAALHARRGKARNRLRQYEGALTDYSAALKSDSRRWEWWLGRANAAAGLGRWEQVAADCTKATELDGRRGEAWQQLGRAEAQRGEWKKAADALTKAVRFGAEEPAMWYELALAQLSAGDEKGYRRTCARMVKKFGDADDAAVRRLVADACILGPDAVPDFKPLLARAEKAVLETPTDMSERIRLGALLLRAGQLDRAVEVLGRCFDKDQPRRGEAWLLAVAYQRSGAKEKAKTAFGQAEKAKERADTTWHERQAERLWRKEAETAIKGG
jgi:tetratricopeptide (TPR) repeat protein